MQSSSLSDQFHAHFAKSASLYEEAKTLFPNGVTHDLRYLTPFPIYVDRALGAHKWSVEGHRLIDFWSGHGSLLLGHSHPAIVEAVRKQMSLATHPGACHALEIEWGRRVRKLLPAADAMRFVSSGTEATLMALRLARIQTGKPGILKFKGHYHGWHDFLIPDADPPFGQKTPGVPDAVASQVVALPPNNASLVEQTLAENPHLGCVILEPTGGHFGQVPIRGQFLHELRDITRRLGRVLIFDEVITGFRVHPGGAQGQYGVVPDLSALAKVLAGGLPGGCLAGKAEIMAHLQFRPDKPKMRHPGTFNANPLSAAAGIAALDLVATGTPCEQANRMGKLLRLRLNELFQKRGLPWVCYGEFSGFKLLPGYTGPAPEADGFIPFDGDASKLEKSGSKEHTHAFRQALLIHGVDWPGLGGMTMASHNEEDINQAVAAVGSSIELLTSQGITWPAA